MSGPEGPDAKASGPARPPSGRGGWLVVAGQSFSSLGDAMLLVVLPLMVLDRTGSPLEVSLVFVLTQAPAFLGFLAGTPRRYVGPRPLLVGYDLTRAALTVGIVGLVGSTSRLSAAVYLMVFLVNLCSALFRPARIEFVAHVVPPDALRRFNSYDRTLESLARAAGAALGGYAYSSLPLPGVFLVCAATFLLSGVALLPLRLAAPRTGDGAGTRVTVPFRSAVGSVRRSPVLRYLIGGEAVTGVAFGVFLAVFVVYVRRNLSASSVSFGHAEMVQAVAATAAGVAVATGRVALPTPTMAVVGYLGMGTAILLVGLNSTLWRVFPLMVLLGGANMLYAVAVRTLLQEHSDAGERVHVFALESVLSRLAQIGGTTVAGVLLGLGGLRAPTTLVVAGALVIAVAAWGHRVLLVAGRRRAAGARATGE